MLASEPIRDNYWHESWNWLVKSKIPGGLSPVIENVRAVFPDPTDCPWVSKDVENSETRRYQIFLRFLHSVSYKMI